MTSNPYNRLSQPTLNSTCCAQIYGRDWGRLDQAIPGKTLVQIKNYFQNYKSKLGLDRLPPIVTTGVTGRRRQDELEPASMGELPTLGHYHRPISFSCPYYICAHSPWIAASAFPQHFLCCTHIQTRDLVEDIQGIVVGSSVASILNIVLARHDDLYNHQENCCAKFIRINGVMDS